MRLTLLAVVASLSSACGGGSSIGTTQESANPAGTLDPSFGRGGTVITSRASIAGGIALQPDGKIVLAAREWVIRYDSTGAPDPAFGTNGFVSAAHDGGSFFAGRVAVQGDGRILVTGSFHPADGGGAYHCALARYTNDGVVDPGFGNAGLVVWDPRGNVSDCMGVATQPDGGILVGIHLGTVPLLFGAIARYRPDGVLDIAFGDHGAANGFGDIAVLPDGRIVAAWPLRGHGFNQCAIGRFSADGVLDDSFGDHGYVSWTGPFDERAPLACALATQGDGGIVVLNYGSVARFLHDGEPDRNFGTDGVAMGLPGQALAVQANGKIVVAGGASTTYPPTGFALWRLDSTGRLDPGFGSSGHVVTPLLGFGEVGYLAIQPDGRIVASGWSSSDGAPNAGQAALVRYFGD